MRIALALVFLASSITSTQTPQCTSTGDIEIVPFVSKIFPAPRNLQVLLPEGYRRAANRNRRYPVLYLNDGQNLFDVCTSLFNPDEWRVDETVSNLIAQVKLEPLIVVGIDNRGKRLRTIEYLPYVDDTLKPPEPNPQGKLYPQFLLGEVVPFIEEHYRVQTGAANRVLGGSSYGAGIALFTVMQCPGSFEGLLLESPSIYADNYHLVEEAESVKKWPRRIFIGTGTLNEPLEDVKRLESLLQKAGLGPDRVRVVVQNGGAHSEKWWALRLPDSPQFLFPK